jgi:plastocyanin
VAVACCAAPVRRSDAADKERKAPKNVVTIKDRKYTPATLTIKAGETVTWVNKDDHDHTVDALTEDEDDEKAFQSGNLSNGDTFRQEFSETGKFKYGCSYHPRMKGMIVVVAGDD